MKILLVLFTSFIIFTTTLFAQEDSLFLDNDFYKSPEYLAWEKQQNKSKKKRAPEDKVYDRVDETMEVTAHILIDKFGKPVIDSVDIVTLLASAAPAFEPVGIDFSLCKVSYFTDHNYDTISVCVDSKNIDELQRIYYEPNTLNIYFVLGIIFTDCDLEKMPAGLGGPGTMNTGGVYLRSYSKGVLVHELGHYFGLAHTHDPAENIDDTPPEPNLGTPYIMDGCQYVGPRNYQPAANNIMSYVSGACKCDKFTEGQYRKILETYDNMYKGVIR